MHHAQNKRVLETLLVMMYSLIIIITYSFSIYFSGSCDLAFMLDTSTSIGGEANFQLTLTFIVSVFEAIGVSAQIRFAFIQFGSSAEIMFSFSKYSSMSEIRTSVMGAKMSGGECKAGVALSAAREMYSGARKEVSRILIVMLAGSSADSVDAGASGLKESGVKIIGIGMGGSYSKEHLGIMISSSSYMLVAASYSSLSGLTSQCVQLVIQGTRFC